MKKLIFLTLVSLVFVGCTAGSSSSNGNPTDSYSSNVVLKNTSWKLTDISGEKITPVAINGKEVGAVTIKFDGENRVSGKSAVNNYFGSYKQSGKKLEFSQIGGTLMAGDPKLMTLEEKYLGLISDVNEVVKKDSSTLVLKTSSGQVLTFIKSE